MDRNERMTVLARLKATKASLVAQLREQRRVNNNNMPNNVVSFPGNQNVNPNFQQVNPNNGTDFVNGMPNNVTPLSDGGTARPKVRRMNPPSGIPVMTENDRNELPRAGFASGLILASITFVTELLFLAISYFMFK